MYLFLIYTPVVIDLEFAHSNSKCYLKMSIIVIIGEPSSSYPFALFLGLYPSWSFNVSETWSIGETANKIKQRGNGVY